MRLHLDPAPVQLSVEPETLLRLTVACPGEHPDGDPLISALIRTPIVDPVDLPACPVCGTVARIWTSEDPADDSGAALFDLGPDA